jgi:hypothetical protein
MIKPKLFGFDQKLVEYKLFRIRSQYKAVYSACRRSLFDKFLELFNLCYIEKVINNK